jgi:hypothetical protein
MNSRFAHSGFRPTLPKIVLASKPKQRLTLLRQKSGTLQTAVCLSGFCQFVKHFLWSGKENLQSGSGLPDFSWYMVQKPGKMYQMNTKFAKRL